MAHGPMAQGSFRTDGEMQFCDTFVTTRVGKSPNMGMMGASGPEFIKIRCPFHVGTQMPTPLWTLMGVKVQLIKAQCATIKASKQARLASKRLSATGERACKRASKQASKQASERPSCGSEEWRNTSWFALCGTRRPPSVTSDMDKEGPRFGNGRCKRGGVGSVRILNYAYLMHRVCSTPDGFRLKTRRGNLDGDKSLWCWKHVNFGTGSARHKVRSTRIATKTHKA